MCVGSDLLLSCNRGATPVSVSEAVGPGDGVGVVVDVGVAVGVGVGVGDPVGVGVGVGDAVGVGDSVGVGVDVGEGGAAPPSTDVNAVNVKVTPCLEYVCPMKGSSEQDT